MEAVPTYRICHGSRRGLGGRGRGRVEVATRLNQETQAKLKPPKIEFFFASKDGCAGLVRQLKWSLSKNSLPNLGCGGLCTRPASPAGIN